MGHWVCVCDFELILWFLSCPRGKGEGGYLSSGVIILYASIAISLISFRAMVLTEATEEVWNIALATGANVLALTVPEAAVRDASLVRRRDTLNALIEEHVAEGLYVLPVDSALLAVASGSADGVRLVIIWISAMPFLISGWRNGSARLFGMMDCICESRSISIS